MPDYPVSVVGTGPAGLIAALAVAGQGVPVGLVGPQANLEDRRTTAIMAPQLAILDELGVGAELRRTGTPLRAMRIVDGTRRLVRAPTVTFHAAEIDEDAFGLNLSNSRLVAALVEAVEAAPEIEWHRGVVERWTLTDHSAEALLDDGTPVTARLAIGADGRNSTARTAAGIRMRQSDGRQSAVVFNISHDRGHEFISTEFHTEEGPFTQVPLEGNRSSIVWVVRPQRAVELMSLSESELALAAEERMQSMLGRVSIDGGRQVYPLASAMPDRFAARRIALVGEAAHVFPPIGAQGLNLGIRDAKALAETVAEQRQDPGGTAALQAYDRRRRPDILARASAVELLNRSLLSGLLPAQLARAAGLSLLDGVAPLRGFFMREGLSTGSGFSALFGSRMTG